MRLRKRWVGLVLLGLGALALVGSMAAVLASPGPDGPDLPDCPPGRPVVLDPGHGGIDGGANVPGMLEKSMNLDIALRTRRYLEHYGVPVVMTRTADVDLGGPNTAGRLRRDLIYRIRVANHCRALLMLSIHVNATTNQTERGMMLFYQHSRPSRDAAHFIDDVLRRWPLHARQEAPIPRSDFAVLRWSKAPAVLVETGFLTHPDDRALLAEPEYRDQVARALGSAVVAIYRQWSRAGER